MVKINITFKASPSDLYSYFSREEIAFSRVGESHPLSIGTILSVIRKDLLLFKCSNAFFKVIIFYFIYKN